MKFRPSILTASILGILLLSMCSNPIIEELFKTDPRQKPQKDGPGFDFTTTGGAWEWHDTNGLPILKSIAPGTQNPQLK